MRPNLAVALMTLAGLGSAAACGDGGNQATTTSPKSGATIQGGGCHEAASPVAQDARHVRVTARSLAFEPKEITVRAGEDIAIVLSSEDGLHDFTVDDADADAHVSAAGGGTSVGGLRADKPGRYPFYCSVQGHREAGMEGTLVVEA